MSKKDNLIKGRYRKVEVVGEGAYGMVVKCVDAKTDKYVAIKVCKYEQEMGISSTILREVSLLRMIDHPNVVPLLDVLQEEGKDQRVVYLIFPFIKEDLAKHLRRVKVLKQTNVRVILGNIQNLMYQLVSGLYHLHMHQVIHRDLKPQNILVDDNGDAVIADLGLSREYEANLGTVSKEVGTLWYRPIEVLLGDVHYGPAIDAWSLGCIFYELAAGEVLFRSDGEIDAIMRIFRKLGTPDVADYPKIRHLPDFKPTFPKFPKRVLKCPKLNEDGNDLLNQLLQINPDKRINMKQALDHPYFKYAKRVGWDVENFCLQ